MIGQITLIECPRDAWQGMKKFIPTAVKAAYLRALIEAGFRHIDAVSFVSPKAVPQMADSEEVLLELGPTRGVEIIGIVMNRKGTERAIATKAVSTVGFPFSVSPTFGMRNQRQTTDESFAELSAIHSLAASSGLNTVAYLSMAFGNPYGDFWSVDTLIEATERVQNAGVLVISLADTVGCATAAQISEIFNNVHGRFPGLEIGVHLHGRPENAEEMVRAAFDAGCRRFDSALGGFGGCPFVQDDRVGNLPTERVLNALELKNFIAEEPLASLLRRSQEIAVVHSLAHSLS
jgi:hydroxymethylglutaryl-CoA lyase